jgi:tetratricopeptide (TPR) repeat protein
VVARTSSFAFKGRHVDVREIGEQLGVAFVLEGSVRKGGSKLRITAQLIDAVTGHHLWSERYDRDISDVFAVQDELTAAIRDALAERLLHIGEMTHQVTPAIDPATYELFLRGRHLVQRRAQGMIEGLAMIQDVIARAPGYAPAFANLAWAEATLVWYSAQRPADGWPKVAAAAERARELDPNLSSTYEVLGGVSMWYEWDFPKARRIFEKGLSISPNSAEGYSHMAWLELADGTDEAAIATASRAAALDPLNPSVVVNLVQVNYLCRRFQEALDVADKLLQIVPDYAEAMRWRSRALVELGRLDEGLAAAELAVRLTGRHVWTLMNMHSALRALGRFDESRAISEELHRRAERELILPVTFTYVDSFDTEPNPDVFFERIARSIAERDFWVIMAHREPELDPFRSDPRFDEVLRRIGLRKIQRSTS